MQTYTVEREIDGRSLRIETGKLAKQAGGSVLISLEDTVVLTAATEGPPRGEDFFPLTVDYRERAYAAGKFPGGFRKREGAPGNKEILTMRLTDRPIRPLFPKSYFNEVQIQSLVLCFDGSNDADIVSMIGSSAALHVSNMPFEGPIGAVRVGRVDGKLIVFPTIEQTNEGDLDLVLAGDDQLITMIEGFGKEIADDEMVEALLFGHGHIKTLVAMQKELREKVGLGPVVVPEAPEDVLFSRIREKYFDEVREANRTPGKLDRQAKVEVIAEKVREEFVVDSEKAEETVTKDAVDAAFYKLRKATVRDLIRSGVRPDGRAHTDLRPLYSEVGLLPRTHGSSLFQRGETQALTIATLGGAADEQRVDGLADEFSKRFMLDYNFPPFSVGETRAIRGPGRREIGHGALAERSLHSVLPATDRFPYTIRLVTEILESNGSSSMATVCGGTLCLMEAGVPIRNPVAGISIGLIKESEEEFTLLTDIMGEEDYFGDMDFKVAGTQRGITGIQLDLKVRGIGEKIIRETLAQATKARIEILRHMLTTLKRPNKQISEFAPRVLRIKIDSEKIGMVIGPGGKHIRALQESTKTSIGIEDDGTVTVCGQDLAGAEEARNRIEAMTEDVKVGRVYKGKVSSVTDFGAFVEIAPGRDGLVHISELDEGYVSRVTDICQIGDDLEVQVIGVDDHDRIKLSRKVLLKKQS